VRARHPSLQQVGDVFLFSREALSGHVQLAGFRGAPQTVALICRYALDAQKQRPPLARLFAESIVSGLYPKAYLCEMNAVNNFVLAHTRYMNDPRTVELVKRPERILRDVIAGRRPSIDCDDYVCLLAALFLAMGRRVRVVTVAFARMTFQGNQQYSHVFLQAQEPYSKRWVVYDPVAAEDTEEMLRNVKAIKYWPIA